MILLYNAKIWGQKPEINSLIIKDGKIHTLGSYSDLNQEFSALACQAQKINLKNKLLLPSFIDSHTHFAEYIRLKSQINMKDAKNLNDIKKLIKENPNKTKGYGLKLSHFDKTELHTHFKNLTDRIITIASSDYHSYFSSGIGLTDTPQDAVQASLCTCLSESSSHTCPIHKIPNENIKKAISDLYKYGITSIHEMGYSKKDYKLMQSVRASLCTCPPPEVQASPCACLPYPPEICTHFPLSMLDEIIKSKKHSYTGSESLKLGSYKFFYDGSIGSNTALLFPSVRVTPCGYPLTSTIKSKASPNISDTSTTLSILETTPSLSPPLGNWEALKAIESNIIKALSNNLSVSVHAIGDKAVDDMINIFIKHKNLIKNFVRIEHAQTITDETLKKLETMKDKIYLSMQALHIRDDYDLLKEMYIKNTSFRFKSLENIVVGFGSDTPVVEFSPFLGIYHAITHKLNPLEAITPEKAIDNYTINAAKLSNSESIKGSIDLGKLANLILIDDYKDYDDSFWLNCKNYLTILNGNIVFNELF